MMVKREPFTISRRAMEGGKETILARAMRRQIVHSD